MCLRQNKQNKNKDKEQEPEKEQMQNIITSSLLSLILPGKRRKVNTVS